MLSEVSSLNSLWPHHQAVSFLVLKKQTGETCTLGQDGQSGWGVAHLGLNLVPAMWKLKTYTVAFYRSVTVLFFLCSLFLISPHFPVLSNHSGCCTRALWVLYWPYGKLVFPLLATEGGIDIVDSGFLRNISYDLFSIHSIHIGTLVTDQRLGLGIKESQECILILNTENVFFILEEE